jgi:hypothetical protein
MPKPPPKLPMGQTLALNRALFRFIELLFSTNQIFILIKNKQPMGVAND